MKQLVELHAGTISVASEGLGRGSTFTLRLPLADSARTGAELREPTPTTESVRPRRILVADDNVDAATSLRHVLELAGHDVEVADDGLDACVRAASYRPDAVLLDLGMPKLDGYGACRAIRANSWGRDTLIVALTGWGQDEERRKPEQQVSTLIWSSLPATTRSLLSWIPRVLKSRAEPGNPAVG